MGSARTLTPSRAAFFAALTTALALCALEGGLRLAGAAILWRARAEVAPGGATPGELWALGDSYTFGVGAGDPATESWPAVAVHLASRERALTLRNLARPGLNSTEIVDALEEALEDGGRPAVVAVLAGINNIHWLGHSGQFCLEDQEASSSLLRAVSSSRTYKLLRWAVLAVRPLRDTDRACVAVSDGFQHLDEGRPDAALARFEASVAADPEGGWGHLGVGLSLVRMGRHADALPALARADALGVRPPALAIARGFSARAAGNGEEAAIVAADPHPGDLQPFAALLAGWIAFDEGRLGDAGAAFQAILDAEGEPAGGVAPFALDGLGWVLLTQGDLDAAEAAFARAERIGGALHITPHLLGWPQVGLGRIAWERGRPGDAQVHLETACRDSSAAATARALGAWMASVEGDAERARNLLGASLAITRLPLAVELAALLEGGGRAQGVPSFVPAVTVAIQQWLDPADTRLVEADLARAGVLAGAVGARLLVLTYPQPKAHPELAAAHARAAARAGATFVDPRSVFEDAHRALGSWEPLLIGDGHPTTRGYALIGELVAKAIETGGVPGGASPAPEEPGAGAPAPQVR
jgi:lysophospholipase L1-like esterase